MEAPGIWGAWGGVGFTAEAVVAERQMKSVTIVTVRRAFIFFPFFYGQLSSMYRSDDKELCLKTDGMSIQVFPRSRDLER